MIKIITFSVRNNVYLKVIILEKRGVSFIRNGYKRWNIVSKVLKYQLYVKYMCFFAVIDNN